jgi:hypothetical protein
VCDFVLLLLLMLLLQGFLLGWVDLSSLVLASVRVFQSILFWYSDLWACLIVVMGKRNFPLMRWVVLWD